MIHVYPVNDIRDHELEGTECPCKPRIEDWGADSVVVHHAWDGREKTEVVLGDYCKHAPGNIAHEVDRLGLEFCECQKCGVELEREIGSNDTWHLSYLGLFYPGHTKGERE